jgi:hypothetical protein
MTLPSSIPDKGRSSGRSLAVKYFNTKIISTIYTFIRPCSIYIHLITSFCHLSEREMPTF